jgi:ankyrin repeat protein
MTAPKSPRSSVLASFVLGILILLTAGFSHAGSYEEALAAARSGDAGTLQKLLARGLDPDIVDENGNTLLILAARAGYADAVARILKFRPKLGSRNAAGDSALMLAALKGNRGVVEKLLAAGAPLNHDGWTPLMYAAFEGHCELVDLFLQMGAAVNARAPNKATPLMLAARNGYVECTRMMIKAGADLDATNDRGLTADAWARSNGNTDVAELIVAARRKQR